MARSCSAIPRWSRKRSGTKSGPAKNAVCLLVLMLGVTVPLQSEPRSSPGDPFQSNAELRPYNPIDQIVLAHLEKNQVRPAHICSDEVFVRRVYLDVIGTLPSAVEVRDFLLDASPDKRARLIDRLLAREEFADYWAMKWSDLLRVKAEFPINLWPNAAQAYHRWIRTSIKENKPYDRFAHELLTSSGSNFREAPVNFYRAMQNRDPQGIARTVALTFMGTRAEKWSTNRLAELAAFFSAVGYKATAEWKEEIVYFDSTKVPVKGEWQWKFPDGTTVRIGGEDPRRVFADWLVNRGNPWFARAMANRVWFWLIGHGLVHEPDDLRPDNPPVLPELLALLESEFTASGYDFKKLCRAILCSQTYQLSASPAGATNSLAAPFAAYPLRRLEAEVLIDAINQITGSSEKYSSLIPEPFTFLPDDQRSIALPDGSITSAFLELFGRPPRDTGLESERNNSPTPAQKLHLLNSSHILRKIEQSRLVELQARPENSFPDIARAIYLCVLSRSPTAEELRVATDYFNSGIKPRVATVDLTWALLNSPEFLYRH